MWWRQKEANKIKTKALEAVGKVEMKIKGLELGWGDIPHQDLSVLRLPDVWTEYMPGKWGTLIDIPNMPGTMFVCDIQDGEVWPPHYHLNNTEWLFILEGSLACFVRASEKDAYTKTIINTGESICFPQGHAHHVRAIGYCLYIVYWIPPLPDEPQ